MTGTIKIAIVDDNRFVRDGLASLLSGVVGLGVVHASARVDVGRVKADDPNVILVDSGLRGVDSVRLVTKVKTEISHAGVVMMDVLPVHEDILSFVAAGVDGFVLKDATVDELVETVTRVASGERVLPMVMTQSLFSQIVQQAVDRDEMSVRRSVRMTDREREVVELISDGMSNREIAASLGVAVHTVKSHVRNIMEKLMLHSRLQIATYSRDERDR